MFEALAEAYGWHLDDVAWRYSLPQVSRLLDARSRRFEREKAMQDAISEGMDPASAARVVGVHPTAETGAPPKQLVQETFAWMEGPGLASY